MAFPGGFDPSNRRAASELDFSITETDILGKKETTVTSTIDKSRSGSQMIIQVSAAGSPSRPLPPSAPPIMSGLDGERGGEPSIPGSLAPSPPHTNRSGGPMKLPPMRNVVHPMPQSSSRRGSEKNSGSSKGGPGEAAPPVQGWRAPEPTDDPYTTEVRSSDAVNNISDMRRSIYELSLVHAQSADRIDFQLWFNYSREVIAESTISLTRWNVRYVWRQPRILRSINVRRVISSARIAIVASWTVHSVVTHS